MNERERILDLVKRCAFYRRSLRFTRRYGKAKDEKQINKAAAEVTADKNATSPFDDTENDDEMFTFDSEENFVKTKRKTKKILKRFSMV